MVQVLTPSAKGASVTTTNDYDALGRRIRTHKHVVVPRDLPIDFEHYYYYDGSRLIEQRDGAGSLERHYVWGLDYVTEQVAQ